MCGPEVPLWMVWAHQGANPAKVPQRKSARWLFCAVNCWGARSGDHGCGASGALGTPSGVQTRVFHTLVAPRGSTNEREGARECGIKPGHCGRSERIRVHVTLKEQARPGCTSTTRRLQVVDRPASNTCSAARVEHK